jgi:hypothetical protein
LPRKSRLDDGSLSTAGPTGSAQTHILGVPNNSGEH